MSTLTIATSAPPAWIQRSEAFAEDLQLSADTLPAGPTLHPAGRVLACLLPMSLALLGAAVSTFASVV